MNLLKITYIVLNLYITMIGLQNYKTDGGQLILTGEFLNFVQISTNDWKMPVFAVGYVSGYQDDGFHVKGNSKTNFKFLCDWFETPIGDLSIGDIMIGYGIGLIIFNKNF